MKSRTYYSIEVMECSVVWQCSKLQVSIATSAMKSEYTALLMALCVAISLKAVWPTFINKGLGLNKDKFIIIRSENIFKPNYHQYTTRVQSRTYFYTVFPRSTYLFYPTYR